MYDKCWNHCNEQVCWIHHILTMRMAAVSGFLTAFDSTTEGWTEYIERLEFYLAVNGIMDTAKQQALLLS